MIMIRSFNDLSHEFAIIPVKTYRESKTLEVNATQTTILLNDNTH